MTPSSVLTVHGASASRALLEGQFLASAPMYLPGLGSSLRADSLLPCLSLSLAFGEEGGAHIAPLSATADGCSQLPVRRWALLYSCRRLEKAKPSTLACALKRGQHYPFQGSAAGPGTGKTAREEGPTHPPGDGSAPRGRRGHNPRANPCPSCPE